MQMSLTFSVIPAALPKTPGPQQEPSVPTLWPSYQGHYWWVEASQQKRSWVSLWWRFFDLDEVVFNIVTRVLVVSYDSNVNDKTIIKASVTSDTLICLFFIFSMQEDFLLICSSDIIITPLIRKRRTGRQKQIYCGLYLIVWPYGIRHQSAQMILR